MEVPMTIAPCMTSTPLQQRARNLAPLQLKPFYSDGLLSPRQIHLNNFRAQNIDDSAYDSMCDPLLPRSLLGTPKSGGLDKPNLSFSPQLSQISGEFSQPPSDLLCGLCQGIYRDPRVLACFHSFCRECLDQHAAGLSRVNCPACNSRTQLSQLGVDGLLADYALIHAVKIHELKEGNIDRFELEVSKTKKCHCLEHRSRPLQFYCLSCDFAVCQECTQKDHPRPMHQLEPIENAAQAQLMAIENLIDEVNLKQRELRTAFQQIETIQRRVNTSQNQATAKLRETLNRMIQVIQDAHDCLQKDLDATYIHRQEQIVSISRGVQKMTGKISETVKFAQRLLKYGRPAEVLVFKPLLEARLRGFLTFNAETEMILNGNMEIEQPRVEATQVVQALTSLCLSGRPDSWNHADSCHTHHHPAGSLLPQSLVRPSSSQYLRHSSSSLSSLPPISRGLTSSSVQNLNALERNNTFSDPLDHQDLRDSLNEQFQELSRFSSGLDLSASPQGSASQSDLNSRLLGVYGAPRAVTATRRERMIYYHKFGEFGIQQGQFTEPSGVAVTAQNEIVVADTNNHRIQVFDREGNFKFMFGECGKRDGQLLYPNRVAVNRITGEFIVTERSPTHQIQVFNQYGHFLRKFGANILQHPRGVCVDYQGRIVVVECKVMRVIIFDAYGNVLHKFLCSRYLEFPNAVCTNDKDQLFISDNRAHCIKVFNYHGQFLHQIGGEGITNYPIGMGITINGEIVVADNHNNFNLTVFTQSGELISAMESRVKHAQCFDVALIDGNTIVLASKDYRLYCYRFITKKTDQALNDSGVSN
ncbi:unnamed protein product [Bursaphelenchus xylophilus]|uniref:(pine wood nematode) hypothetical protein n=1 Tax=Bursaphelenchus xylophilus TaxID=6326 RepID=A0A1I7S7K0_BURXY|nr:unnamed protein product [Bursaphelenchus xylophilus]CAG9111902.1 unnamed protein product [Bursaphelenchus xylophilus]